MTQDKTSAEVLAKIWEDFARTAERVTGLPVRKSATSRHYLNGDNRLLTRWLNPGAHKNWRIPLARVPDVCSELNASPQMMDKLMMAKFGEISEGDPKHPVLVAAWWALQHCERQNYGLSQDERQVLDAFREQAKRFPRGLSGTSSESERVGQLFSGLLAQAERDQETEMLEAEPESSAILDTKRKALAVSEALKRDATAKAGVRRSAAYSREKSVARQVRDYLKDLKRRRP